MSTPSQESLRGRASRWWGRNVTTRVNEAFIAANDYLDTRRGTATVKAAFAQAARDVRKQTDPTILRAIGNARLSKADLQLLAQTQVEARFGGRDGDFAGALEQRARALVQEAADRPRSLLSYLPGVERFNAWRAERRGAAALKGAYAQAARDVKRTMDPDARREVGASKITKFELRQLMRTDMADALRPSNRNLDGPTAPEVGGPDRPGQQLGNQQANDPQVERPQAERQQTGAGQAQEEGKRWSVSGDLFEGTAGELVQEPQVQAEGTAQGRSRLEQAAFRLGAAVGTASRWASNVQTKATAAAREFRDAYNDRRQDPTSENAQRNGERVPAREIIERLQAENAQQSGQRVPARDIIERVQAENAAATASQAVNDPQIKAELAETMRRGLDNTASGFQSVPSNLNGPAATAESQQPAAETTQAATTESTQPGTTQNAENPTSKWVHQGRAAASEAVNPRTTSGQGEAQRTGGDQHRTNSQERNGNERGGS